MRFMVMVKATPNSEKGVMPEPEMFEAMMKYNEQLVNAGIMKAGDGLQPSSKGKRVQYGADGKLKGVVDGPFPETKELVAGFWMWECKSWDEAMAWAKKCPTPMPGEACEIEVRQVYEVADFGDAIPPEMVEKEKELTERIQRTK